MALWLDSSPIAVSSSKLRVHRPRLASPSLEGRPPALSRPGAPYLCPKPTYRAHAVSLSSPVIPRIVDLPSGETTREGAFNSLTASIGFFVGVPGVNTFTGGPMPIEERSCDRAEPYGVFLVGVRSGWSACV